LRAKPHSDTVKFYRLNDDGNLKTILLYEVEQEKPFILMGTEIPHEAKTQ
jgi:hypothetical protein